MASHILPFLSKKAPSAGSTTLRPRARGPVFGGRIRPEAEDVTDGPQLIHSHRHEPGPRSRLSESQVRAHRIVAQVEREIAERAQRERAERSEVRRVLPATEIRPRRRRMPAQATEVRLRHRVLDALFFFFWPMA